MRSIHINFDLPLDGTIIDFETTHYDVTKGELITAGFLVKSGVLIFQRLELIESEFKEMVIKKMKSMPKPWYAFNKKFEESFIQLSLENELQKREYESAFGALLEEGLLEHYNSLCNPLFNDEIPKFWNAWQITNDKMFVSKIVRHNYCCLIKEYYLKQKRMDKLDVDKIKRFPSSAQMEKRYIQRQLI